MMEALCVLALFAAAGLFEFGGVLLWYLRIRCRGANVCTCPWKQW